MTFKTTYLEKSIFHQNIREINKNILNKYLNSTFVLTDDLYKVQRDSFHFLSKLLSPKTNLEKTYFHLLAKAILQSESLSGGSAVPGFIFSTYFLEHLFRQQEYNHNTLKIKKEFEEISSLCKTLIEDNQSPTIQTDLDKLVMKISEDDLVLADVILQSLNLAGLKGKIYVEDSKNMCFTLEKKVGYSFNLKPLKIFLSTFGNRDWEHQEVKVLLVDGIIEKVSEIDSILSKSFEKKEPMLILARGFSEEIIATLKINFDKQLLNIIPVLLPSDLDSINTLNDVSSVCGCDIVSSLKGELLSCVSYDSLATIKKIRCKEGEVTFEESSTQGSVASQIKLLLAKRTENQNVQDIVDLLDKRIKNLTSNTVTIRLPDCTKIQSQTYRSKIDLCLRTVKTYISYGMFFPHTITENLKSKISDTNSLKPAFINAYEKTVELFPDKTSTLSLFLGIYLMSKSVLDIFSSDGMVISSENLEE